MHVTVTHAATAEVIADVEHSKPIIITEHSVEGHIVHPSVDEEVHHGNCRNPKQLLRKM